MLIVRLLKAGFGVQGTEVELWSGIGHGAENALGIGKPIASLHITGDR
jgi:hypothetical protein